MSFTARLAQFRADLNGDFIPSLVAHDFVELMKLEHPAEYEEWVQTHAIHFCADELAAMLRRERHHTRVRARAFRIGAEAGDVSAFSNVFEISPDHTRRRVGEMRGADHLYVAERYSVTGKRALLLAECHRQVATRIGDQRTDEVLTEKEYLDIFEEAEVTA